MARPSAPSSHEFVKYRPRERNEAYVRLEREVLAAVTGEWQTIKDIGQVVKVNRQAIARILMDLHRLNLVEWLPTPVTKYKLRIKGEVKRNGTEAIY